MIVSLLFTVSLVTVCSFEVFSEPASSARRRMRWTAPKTSSFCARKASPMSFVQSRFSDIRLSSSGNCVRPLMLGSQSFCSRALVERVALQVGLLATPAVRLDDLERIRRSDQHLHEERIGVEGDRRHDLIELIGRELRALRLCGRRVLFFGRRARDRCAEQEETTENSCGHESARHGSSPTIYPGMNITLRDR